MKSELPCARPFRRSTSVLAVLASLLPACDVRGPAATGQPAFNKVTAVRDLAAVKDAQVGFTRLGASETAAVLTDLAALEGDPALLDAVKRRSFVERGLAMVDGPRCPLCDQEWDDEDHLKNQRIRAEQRKLEERRTELLGHCMMRKFKADPEAKAAMLRDLEGFLSKPEDRELFELSQE